MEENNISYKNSISKFEVIFKKTKNLKDRIEQEIEKLNYLYDQKKIELAEEYKKQQIELDEKNINMKNELNQFLKESNNVLLSCEKIWKAIENYKIEKDNYEMKTLHYISQIHTNKEDAKNFLKKPIRNLNNFIKSYNLFKKDNYNYYYFSGIPIPKNISTYKYGEQLYISWSIGEAIFNYEIKYSVELKMNGKILTYEVNDTNILIDKFDKNGIYEIKVRAFFDDLFSDWTNIKTINYENITNSVFIINSSSLFPSKPQSSLFGSVNNELKNEINSDNTNHLFKTANNIVNLFYVLRIKLNKIIVTSF